MAKSEVVTLVCDGCQVQDDTVRTRKLSALRGEACEECWANVQAVVGNWRTTRARRSSTS